ncbi:MAG TPA: hypothetical protein VMV69_15965 [Pirellulales bacterium]|nr:hypothetical protein [Pirellulales bacterium]
MGTGYDQTWRQHVAAIQGGAEQESLDAAIAALQPLIEQTATRVCVRRRVGRQVQLDFVESALTAIVAPRETKEGGRLPERIHKYDAETGSFPGWLWKALDRLLLDVTKSRRRRAKHEASATDSGDDGGMMERRPDPATSDLDAGFDRNAPFGDRDLREIEAWPVRDRLRVLVISRLWRKVPEHLWIGWCEEEGMSQPFPDDPEEPATIQDSIFSCAAELGESPEATKQHWYRKRGLLRNLDYVRELRHGH